MGKYFDAIINDFKRIGADFRINDLSEAIEIKFKSDEWRLLDDTTEAIIRTELRELGYGLKGKNKASRTAVAEAWITLANNQRYNPIKAYFENLRQKPYSPAYDGNPSPNPARIEGMVNYFDNPDGWAGRWLFRWLTGAIARVYQNTRNPMLVFSGGQEVGKSTFVRWLCPPELHEFFREGAIKPDSKDDRLMLATTFMQEVPELGNTTRRADVEAFKDHITRKHIVERPPYASKPIRKPAITSFIGTVNHDGAGFLADTTGNSRFLATEINSIDFSYSGLEAASLWREALWFYDNFPRVWELPENERIARDNINSQFEVASALEDVVLQYLTITNEPGDFLSTLKIRQVLAIHYRYTTEQSFNRELSKVLQSLGLKAGRAAYRENGPHHRGWYGVKIADNA